MKPEYFKLPDEWNPLVRHVKDLAENHPNRDCYICPQLLKARSRAKPYAKALRVVWAEFDNGEKLPEGLPQPSIIVESSPGHWHVYWLLSEPEDPYKVEELNRRIAYKYGADGSGWDLSQVLRIPGTTNNKYEDSPTVRLVKLDDTVVYSFDVLSALVPVLSDKGGTDNTAVSPDELPAGLVAVEAEALFDLVRGHVPKRVAKTIEEGPDSYVPLEGGDDSRSGADGATVHALLRAGLTPEQIRTIYRHYPIGTEGKYADRGDKYLDLTIANQTEFIEQNPREELSTPRAERAGGNFEYFEDIRWANPTPLREFPQPPFPVDALPEPLRRFNEEITRELQVPADLPAGLGLGAVATCLQRKYQVEPRRGWKVPLTMWVLALLPSGERKSPTFDYFVEPLQEWQQAAYKKLKPVIARLSGRRDRLQKKVDKANLDYAKAEDGSPEAADAENRADAAAEAIEELEIPPEPQLLERDSTTEALIKSLGHQGGRLSIMSDEGEIFAIVAGKYSKGQNPDCDALLSGHDGSHIRQSRIQRGTVDVPHAHLSIVTTTQPETIESLENKSVLRGKGFFGRFLFSLPKSRLGGREIRQEPVAATTKNSYANLIYNLLGDPERVDESNWRSYFGTDYSPKTLEFSGAADNLLEAFERWIEPQLAPYGDLGSVAEWGSKLTGKMCRIAGIIHATEAKNSGQDPTASRINEDAVCRAIVIAGYYMAHSQAVLVGLAHGIGQSSTEYLLYWLRKNDISEISERDLHQRLRGNDRLKDKAVLESCLDQLEALGYAKKMQRKKKGAGRPQAPVWLFNPKIPEDPPDKNPADDFFLWLRQPPQPDPPMGNGTAPDTVGENTRTGHTQNTQNSEAGADVGDDPDDARLVAAGWGRREDGFWTNPRNKYAYAKQYALEELEERERDIERF